MMQVTRPGIAGQGLRFTLVGGLVAVCNIGTTSLLTQAVGVSFPIAIAVGYLVAITIHFSLQRAFVWAHDADFALSARAQLLRYLPLALGQYAVVTGATTALPGVIGLPEEVVYIGVVGACSVLSFLLFRSHIFHHSERDQPG